MMRHSQSVALVIFIALNVSVESFQPRPSHRGPGTHRSPASSYHAISPSAHSYIGRTHSKSTFLPNSPSSSEQTYYNENNEQIDSLIYQTAKVLRASSWFSWWSQVILTVVSSITFLFARNVLNAQDTTPLGMSKVAARFSLPLLGTMASTLSIMWTWGQRRLARRIVRNAGTSRVEAANLLRRVMKVGVTINLIGLLTSVLGAQFIIGTLIAKSMQSFGGFGGFGVGGVGVSTQILQPLDVLVVQANTNVLSSHFVSLACLLWLSRMVDLLDPPSLEDDA